MQSGILFDSRQSPAPVPSTPNGLVTITTGSGSPEGVVTAPVGSEYLQNDGATGDVTWRKTTGTGNTGWRVVVDAFTGTGSPEGAVTAPVGRIYQQTDGANGDVLWRKVSGSGSAGWRVLVDAYTGTGSPEGVVTASVGRVFQQTDGTNGDTLWTKITGSLNTGWRRLSEAITGHTSTIRTVNFTGASNGLIVNAAVQAAVAAGKQFVEVAKQHQPYDPTQVTFSTAVRMVAEGADRGVLHGLAYGMNVAGGADIGPSMQAMVNYATQNDNLGPGGPEIVLPAGILAWNTLVNAYTANLVRIGAIKIRGQGGHATIIRPTIAPMMMVGGPAGSVTDGFTASDFNIELTTQLYWGDGLFHLRLCRLWHFARINLISGTNPQNDLYTYTGYLLNLDSSYLGVLERCHANGKGVYLFEFNDTIDPAQQCDTVSLVNCSSIGMALGLIHAPTGATDNHNFVFYTPKYLMINTWPEANVSVETTFTSSPIVGATSFTIASATGLAIGNYIWLGIGPTLELALISNLVGTTVTTANTLKYAHTSGDPVLMGGFMVSTAPKCHGVWLDHPHLEFCAMGVYGGGGIHTRVSDAYGTVKEIIRHAAGTTYGMRVERGEWHWPGTGVQCAIRVTAAGDSALNGTFFMDGPFVDPNTGNPPATIFQNDAATNRSYRLRNVLSQGVPVDVVNQGTASSAVLLESVTAGGGTIYERDLNGSQYAWRETTARAALTDGATVNVDASKGNDFQWLAGGSRTVAIPTNHPANGRTQRLTIWMTNNTAGAITTTWTGGGGGFKLAGAWVDPAAGKIRSITFMWEWSGNYWLEVSRSAADA